MDKKLKLHELLEEYKRLDSDGARFDKGMEIRETVIEIKRDRVQFYTHEYLDSVIKGTPTEVKRMGIMLRQATKEYEKVAMTHRYDFKVADYE